MTQEQIQATGNFLSTYYSDLTYISTFQQFKKGHKSMRDYLKKDTGSFYSFLIEFRIVRNISKGSAGKLLNETIRWIDSESADNVDLFAQKLSKKGFTNRKVVASMASKVLFLNNPWLIMPMDKLARKALRQNENLYSVYHTNLEKYRIKNNSVLRRIIARTRPLTELVDRDFRKELRDLPTICENRLLDKLLWTNGR